MKSKILQLRQYNFAILIVILASCSPPPRVAVVERQTIDPRIETEKIGGSHIRIVQPGDTLHAIAFANRLNVNRLAAWNGLSDTGRLNVGQRIRLTRPLNFSETPVRQASSVGGSATKGPSGRTQIKSSGQGSNVKPSTTDSAANTSAPSSRKSSQSVQSTQDRSSINWGWPIVGKVVQHFSINAGRQGIEIQGKIGQGVSAAASGEVVYVGDGLKGYGNLVIVKHNAKFLSAYAHNQQIIVEEGQQVRASQKIATLGKTNRFRNALHFQIRSDGKPVNPLAYLPKS